MELIGDLILAYVVDQFPRVRAYWVSRRGVSTFWQAFALPWYISTTVKYAINSVRMLVMPQRKDNADTAVRII